MTYVLKAHTITGHLVPFNGEHREYREASRAHRDAMLLASILDTAVTVVEFATGTVVATY